MKKSYLLLLSGVLVLTALFFLMKRATPVPSSEVEQLRKKHVEFLKERPSKANAQVSRKERIREGLPPNKYYELMEYLTMNPALGYPEPQKVRALRKNLTAKRRRKSSQKAPGQEADNSWNARGPTNVGGRTRVLLFDPNDESGTRVFAGAISGGLWVNENITSENSPWSRISGLPANMNISCITVDPRDSNIWYVGTGEQYTAGDVMGTGVYKTTDGGASWNKVLDVEQFATSGAGANQRVIGGIHYINDIVAWDNGTSTEIFIGVSTHIYANARNPTNYMGLFDRGLYGSEDGGDTWEMLLEGNSFNDFEVDAAGNLWVATTNSPGINDKGGKIFRRNKGSDTKFSHIRTIPGVLRTEIEASELSPETFYVLAESQNNNTLMWATADAFEHIEPISTPVDADNDIPPDDFARGQAFYNLMIESDPTNDEILYAGAIDLFRSTNAGETWQQISKWSNNNNLEDLPVSLVHADHHVMQFRPGNTNQAIFGHDGGVSFARNLAAASSSDVFITPERDYITTQFYSIAVAPTSFAPGDYFLGGTQDNGTQLIQGGDLESLGILGGDGAHAFYDQVDTQYFIANLVYNNLIAIYVYQQEAFRFIAENEDNDGFFINPQALDSDLDILYSNGPEGILYRYEDFTALSEEQNATRVSLEHDLLNTSISALAVSPFTTESTTLLAGLINGRLLRIEDPQAQPGEASWRNITGNGFLGSISDIEYGSTEQEILVTFYNYGVESIWYTSNALDGNPTWIRKEGNLPDLPVLSILQNPLNKEEVIIGTELGVWATQNFSDDNPEWEQAYNGMSDVKVTDLDLRAGDNTIFAASYGRGMFSGKFRAAEKDEGEEEPDGEIARVEVSVYPTVSAGAFQIISDEELKSVRIEVFNLAGQQVHDSQIALSAGIPVNLDLGHLNPGVYLVKLLSTERTRIQKLVIQ